MREISHIVESLPADIVHVIKHHIKSNRREATLLAATRVQAAYRSFHDRQRMRSYRSSVRAGH